MLHNSQDDLQTDSTL